MSAKNYEPGLRFAITWLHERAREMRDPDEKAMRILNSAAFSLGVEKTRGGFVLNDAFDKLRAENEALRKEVSEAKTSIDDYEYALTDIRRLTRELDVVMHGDSAAEQSSLCDLIEPARALSTRADGLEAELATRRAQIAKGPEPVAWRYRSISPHTGKPTPWLLTQVQYDDEGGLEVEKLGVIASPQPADMEKAVEAALEAYWAAYPDGKSRAGRQGMSAALTAALPFLQGAAWKPTHLHVKSGNEYQLLGIGRMQTEHWKDTSIKRMREAIRCNAPSQTASIDMREVAIYRGKDGQYWARPREEFEDGRFRSLKDDGHEWHNHL